MLVTERPISCAAEDQLGLQPFAATLAKGLREMTYSEGTVVSLHAPWGSGKTSALNLIQRHLAVLDLAEITGEPVEDIAALAAARSDAPLEDERKQAERWNKMIETYHGRKTTVVRFNPSYFSGQESLFKAFFGVLGSELSIAHNTAVAAAAAGLLKRGAEADIAARTGAGLGLGLIASPQVHTAVSIGGFFGKMRNNIFEHKESLEAAMQNMRETLQRSNAHLIIIVDDIDRLMAIELRLMLTLITSFGKLPNITYLLAYDREMVMKLLVQADIRNNGYLEKLGHVSFELPRGDVYSLRSILFGKLDAILRYSKKAVDVFDSHRWRETFISCIDPYVRTPQAIAQLSSSLQVVWPAVEGGVDWSDLVTLETLRLHEPAVYSRTFEMLDLLVSAHSESPENGAWADALMPTADNSYNHELAGKALAHLFPRLAKAWGACAVSHCSKDEARRTLRIQCADYARNYFAFSSSPDQFPLSDIRFLLEAADPQRPFLDILKRASERTTRQGVSMVSRLLEQITEEVSRTPLSTGLARTILAHGDKMIRIGDELPMVSFNSNNNVRLSWLLMTSLRATPIAERAAAVRSWLDGTKGASILIPLIEQLTRMDTCSVSDIPFEACEALRADACRLAELASQEPDFLNAANCADVLFSWMRLTNCATVSVWLKKALERGDAALSLAMNALPSKVHSNTEGEYFRVDRAAWSQLLDVDQFSERLRAGGAADPENKVLAEAIAKIDTALARDGKAR